MIKKKGRGGARKGAGRKPVIKRLTWIDIGILCERLQKEGEEVARGMREQRPGVKKVREFQKLVVERRITSQSQRDAVWKLIFKNSRPTDWVAGLKGTE